MRASEFLADLVRRLESVDLEYALVGSIAAMSYGEPRATLDIDVVVALGASQLGEMERLFPAPEFYLSMEAAREAARSKAQFNVIHPGSGMKVDFFVAGDAVEESQIRRRLRQAILPGVEAWCSPPEELIVKKLSYYQQGPRTSICATLRRCFASPPGRSIWREFVGWPAARSSAPSWTACWRPLRRIEAGPQYLVP